MCIRDRREATKAVLEMVSAVVESSVAATQATTALWWGLALAVVVTIACPVVIGNLPTT